jgi:hypothetical protein
MTAPIRATGAVLAALRTERPALWRDTVRRALRDAGEIGGAATALGVSKSALEKWLAGAPELRDGIELRGRGRPKHA